MTKKLITPVIAWKPSFPVPPEGWAILPESPLPYVVVNKEKYHVYLMGNPDTRQLSWLVLGENGLIPDMDTYKKAAETATVALFFDESVMDDFLTTGAHSELIKWYLQKIENVKMLKNFLLLIFSMGLSATRRASETFMNTYTKELGSYHGIHVVGGNILKSPMARRLSKKVAADAARQAYYSTLGEELVKEYGKEFGKEYLAGLTESMTTSIESQFSEDYVFTLFYPPLVYTIGETVKKEKPDENIVTFLIGPNEPVEHYIAKASTDLASEHLMRAYVIWAIKNGLNLEEIKTNADNAIHKAWSQQSLISENDIPRCLDGC
ncbi:hypothetical protein [Thermococcus sp.]